MSFRIQIRRDTAANWTSANPVLLDAEMGYETDTEKLKIGDGVNNYNDLTYWPGAISGVDLYGPTGSFSPGATGIGLTGDLVTTQTIGGVPYYDVSGTAFRTYGVRFDYDITASLGSGDDTILSGNPWTSDGLTINISSESDVRFNFANEVTPPKNITGYFYKATEDKYYLTTFGLGSVGYAKTTTLNSNVVANIATNDFFSDFSDGNSGNHEIQLDLTASNYGGAQNGSPTILIHAYVIFTF